MSDHDQSTPPDALVEILRTLAEGGLPQIVAGPAGKAISRLIAGAADIPAAWLEKHSQSIRDEKDARSTIIKSIADAAAVTAASDPQTRDRAIARFANDLYRKQENREAVARLTAEHLRVDPPPLESDGPTDDWMNSFQRYAEDASSDEFREIWAKILAREVRKRGAISTRSLQLISGIDLTLAKLIERALKYAANGSILDDLLDSNFSFEEAFALQDCGFVATHGQFGSQLRIKSDEDGYGTMFTSQFIFRLKTPNGDAKLSCHLLTRFGQDLAETLKVELDAAAIARSLGAASPKPTEVTFAKIVSRTDKSVKHEPWQSS